MSQETDSAKEFLRKLKAQFDQCEIVTRYTFNFVGEYVDGATSEFPVTIDQCVELTAWESLMKQLSYESDISNLLALRLSSIEKRQFYAVPA